MPKQKILFTSPILHHPPVGGPELRIENSIKALSRVAELHVVAVRGKKQIGGQAAQEFYERTCARFSYANDGLDRRRLFSHRFHTAVRPLDFVLNLPLRALSKLSSLIRKRNRSKLSVFCRDILRYCDRHGIDTVWYGYGNISYDLIRAVAARRPALKTVCDTDSVWSRFILREIPFVDDPRRKRQIEANGRKKLLEERAWVRLCTATTAVSEVDAEYYRSLTTDPGRIHVFSNVIDTDAYETRPAAPEGLVKPCVFLAGTFGHYNSPMDAAARWLVMEVLPLLRRDRPDVHCYIVGKRSRESLAYINDPAVTVVGEVPSVLPYLCNADVSLVPLKFESGTRFKILEAGACGIPIVSTTLGAEGLPVEHNRHIVIADTPTDFAEGIRSLLADRAFAASIAGACRDLVRSDYGIDRLAAEGARILEAIRAGKRTS